MCKHYIWSEGNWWDLGKEALSLANFPQTQPTITTAPALCKQHIVRKEEKVFKKTFMTWFTLQSILTFFKNGPLYQQLWNSSFVTICRMRLVRSLLSLLLGFSTVSSRILEDGELIVDNSILEVEMPRFPGHPWDHVVRFFVFFLVSAWTYLIFVTDTTDMSV